jgi:hypothetical protein
VGGWDDSKTLECQCCVSLSPFTPAVDAFRSRLCVFIHRLTHKHFGAMCVCVMMADRVGLGWVGLGWVGGLLFIVSSAPPAPC